MKFKRKEIILSLLLGVLVPGIVFFAVDKIANKERWELTPATTNTTVAITDNQISVLMEDGAVRKMDLEAYILCVVLREMPAAFESEALKAQAVVARTYTRRKADDGGKHIDAAVCTDSECCQGFLSPQEYLEQGGEQTLLDKVTSAVESTAGQVLTYDGKLIDATYFSCSGGQTEDAKAVWGADIPYLQSTKSPGEESATHYVDTETFTLSEFAELLDAKLSGSPQDWIGKITYTRGGGVDTIFICGQEYKGTTIRQKLGLRSTAFVISIVGETVTITTKGYGHRVGMSQYGADAMAVQGKTYQQILSHYYKDTSLETCDRD